MLRKFISSLFRDKPTMDNVRKQLNDAINMVLSSEKFAEENWAIEVFQKHLDRKGQLIKRIESDMEDVLSSNNIYKTFRVLLFNTIEVSVIYDTLLSDNYSAHRDSICLCIKRGMQDLNTDEHVRQGHMVAKSLEGFSSYEWCYEKAVHESAWAQMKLIVLRQLQISIFEDVPSGSEKDWWDYFREAYEIFVQDYYNLIIKSGFEKAFPHPMVASMANDIIMGMEMKLEESASKP